jgi:hypothetical protein
MVDKFFGIHAGEYNRLLHYARWRGQRVPADLLPIGRDPGGNLICISITGPNQGKIYFWDHEEEVEEGQPPGYDNVYFVAGSLPALLASLTELPAE